ncbi:hypothetical protein [Nostoc sp. UCD120]|uniref:hypothetical protein n=1 Tax=Nostoc sp. UCD120 TaxID=2681312 RepID=UPI001626F797|nr:hypothetical protein [Nostoc sp. UCD120]MBC1225433.1 hypothetical protein [Nostoc sp. UCD120]
MSSCAISLKKLSPENTTAAIGVRETDPTIDVNLKTFSVWGNFACTSALGSLGLPMELHGGSFSGTYTVNVESLLTSNISQVFLTNWTVSLLDSANTVLRRLSKTLPGNTAYIQDNILGFINEGLFTRINSDYYGLGLYFNSNFTGMGSTNNGIFEDRSSLGDAKSYGNIRITFAKSEAVL